MAPEELGKTLKALEAISGLQASIADLYRLFSQFRAQEKDFWLALEADERKHARLAQTIAQAIEGRKYFCAPNASFNGDGVVKLKGFIERNSRKIQKFEASTDLMSLLSIAWNVEYSLSEIKYSDLFSIAEQELENLLREIASDTARHRSQIGSKIAAMRNIPARPHSQVTPKSHPGVRRSPNRKNHLLKLN